VSAQKPVDRTRLATSPVTLLDMLDDVETSHARYLVEREGRPVAVIVSPQEYALLRAALERFAKAP
jgi:PHD/YefM family antitoxin component YafN of YafNO toxin-antitoxin module